MEFITKSLQETKELTAKIIGDLKNKEHQGALVLGLVGELGAGKTAFTQGLAEALGIKEKILSPTFVIMRRFAISDKRFSNLYHIDCYRLESPKDLAGLGFEEILENPKNIVVIEWAEKIKDVLPKDAVWINFAHLGEDNRKIKIKM